VASIGRKVKAVANKTQTGKMKHANCPCVLARGNNGKKVNVKKG